MGIGEQAQIIIGNFVGTPKLNKKTQITYPPSHLGLSYLSMLSHLIGCMKILFLKLFVGVSTLVQT
jgi:hypothetical protein